MRQKLAISIFSIILFFTIACTRDSDDSHSCTDVTITNSAPGCGGWGILYNGRKYPSRNLDDAFKIDGLAVCAQFNLYEDWSLCPCCGGTWADIFSLELK